VTLADRRDGRGSADGTELSALVVDVRRWVNEGKTPRVLVRTQPLAVCIGEVIGGGAGQPAIGLGKRHATSPGAVRLDGSIASGPASAGGRILCPLCGRHDEALHDWRPGTMRTQLPGSSLLVKASGLASNGKLRGEPPTPGPAPSRRLVLHPYRRNP
jgi:hypothetical protein